MVNLDKIKKGDVLGIGSKFSKKTNDYEPIPYTVHEVIDMNKYPNIKKQGVTHMFHVGSPNKKERELTVFKNKNFFYVMDVSGKTIIKGKLSMIKNLSSKASVSASINTSNFIEAIAAKDPVLAKKTAKVLIARDDFDVVVDSGDKLIEDIKNFIIYGQQFAVEHKSLNTKLIPLARSMSSKTKDFLKEINNFVNLVKKMKS